MSKTISIGFTGTRDGLTKTQCTKIINFLNQYKDHKICVFHGDCIGADTDFHKLCEEFRSNNIDVNFVITIVPPDNNSMRGFNNGDPTLKPKPYLERNKDIVRNSDILIGCPRDLKKEELRSGTWSTIRFARKTNKPIELF